MSKVVEEKDVANPRIATLLRARFDHLPPTLFIVAECDPLRDDCYGLSLAHDSLLPIHVPRYHYFIPLENRVL